MAFFSRSSQPASAPAADSLPSDMAIAPNVLIGLRNIEKSYRARHEPQLRAAPD